MINKRYSFVLALVIIVAGIVLSNVLSNQKKPMKRINGANDLSPVKTLKVSNSEVQVNFNIGGRLTAFNKVELYAEVSGILLDMPKQFREGVRFSKEQMLIKIDDSVYKNQVLAQKSGLLNQLTLLLPDFSIDFPERAANWEDYLKNFKIEESLEPLPVPASDQERYYIAAKNIYNQYYQIKSQEATLAKYTISAPFDGIVTESNIKPGTLVRVGQKLGEFANTDYYELAANAGVHDVRHLKPGDPVILTTKDVPGQFKGSIQRINGVLDQESQTIKVYIVTSDKRLRDGMYCTALVSSEKIDNAFQISRNLLLSDNRLYTIKKDSTLGVINVDIAADDDASVIIQGLEEGTMLLGQPLTNAYEGMKLGKMILN